MSLDFEDATGKPRSAEDIAAALRFVSAELVTAPTRMGALGTGPAAIHLVVIRDVLREALARRGG
jgi:hypothetical protein